MTCRAVGLPVISASGSRTSDVVVRLRHCALGVSGCGDQAGDVGVEGGEPAGGVGGQHHVDAARVADLHVGMVLVGLGDLGDRRHQLSAVEVGRATEGGMDLIADHRPVVEAVERGELVGRDLGVLHARQ